MHTIVVIRECELFNTRDLFTIKVFERQAFVCSRQRTVQLIVIACFRTQTFFLVIISASGRLRMFVASMSCIWWIINVMFWDNNWSFRESLVPVFRFDAGRYDPAQILSLGLLLSSFAFLSLSTKVVAVLTIWLITAQRSQGGCFAIRSPLETPLSQLRCRF